jgi:transposase InsO family protein
MQGLKYSIENPLWGGPRIHGELLKLGFAVAQSSVAKYMVKRRGTPGQGWQIFLRNHAPEIAAMDLFVVPTIGFKLLYGFVIVRLSRREIVWINVTTNPTAEWVARQITEAFPWDEAPRYLIRDRDRIYGTLVIRRLRAMGIRDRPTSPAAPWQNGFAERLIGSIRRECLDHVVIWSEAHLRRVLKSYADYYNSVRTHRSLRKDAPIFRPIQQIGIIRSTRSSVGFTIITFGFEFSVYTGHLSRAAHRAEWLKAAKGTVPRIERNSTRDLQTLVLAHFLFGGIGGRLVGLTQLGQAADSSARFEIILPAVLPVGKCRGSGLDRPRTPTATRAAPVLHVTPVASDHNRYRVVVHRFPVETLSVVDGHLHANPIFFRTLSNPVSWNIASWPGPCPLNTLIFSRAPSGSDRRSSTASSL